MPKGVGLFLSLILIAIEMIRVKTIPSRTTLTLAASEDEPSRIMTPALDQGMNFLYFRLWPQLIHCPVTAGAHNGTGPLCLRKVMVCRKPEPRHIPVPRFRHPLVI